MLVEQEHEEVWDDLIVERDELPLHLLSADDLMIVVNAMFATQEAELQRLGNLVVESRWQEQALRNRLLFWRDVGIVATVTCVFLLGWLLAFMMGLV